MAKTTAWREPDHYIGRIKRDSVYQVWWRKTPRRSNIVTVTGKILLVCLQYNPLCRVFKIREVKDQEAQPKKA